MASTHPIAAGLFLALAVGGTGYGAFNATSQRRHAEREAIREAAEARKQMLIDGVTRGQNGDLEGAATVLSAAYRQYPDDEDAAYNFAIALGALGRHDDAEKILSRLLARQPEDWGAVAELASVYDAKGDADRAMQLLEKVPTGQGDMVARFADGGGWTNVRGHARFEALRSKHGLTAAAPTETATSAAGTQLP